MSKVGTMLWRHRYALLVLSVATASLFILQKTQSGTVRFGSLEELRKFAEKHKLHTTTRATVSPVLHIHDGPVSRQRLACLPMVRCGETPEWEGIVRVIELPQTHDINYALQEIGGHHRLWGSVLAFGDRELLDRIEELYTSPPEKSTEAEEDVHKTN